MKKTPEQAQKEQQDRNHITKPVAALAEVVEGEGGEGDEFHAYASAKAAARNAQLQSEAKEQQVQAYIDAFKAGVEAVKQVSWAALDDPMKRVPKFQIVDPDDPAGE